MDDSPELSRRFALADIGAEPRSVVVSADAGERKALARRFGLVSLDALVAHVELAAVNNSIEARGALSARMKQSCVATAQPLSVKLEESFQIRFEPPTTEVIEEEFELSSGDCDVMEHDGQAIDLGEAVAQTLGLAIDPFPRALDADAVLKATGILAEPDVGPFSKLKGLLDKG